MNHLIISMSVLRPILLQVLSLKNLHQRCYHTCVYVHTRTVRMIICFVREERIITLTLYDVLCINVILSYDYYSSRVEVQLQRETKNLATQLDPSSMQSFQSRRMTRVIRYCHNDVLLRIVATIRNQQVSSTKKKLLLVLTRSTCTFLESTKMQKPLTISTAPSTGI